MRRCSLLLSLAALAFSLSSVADGAPFKVMSAPNVMHIAFPENIFVECQDCDNDQIVTIKVLNYPTKSRELYKTTVNLNAQNNYQALGEVMIPPGDFKKDPMFRQYVFLEAHFPDRMLQKMVLVSFQSNYIFVQTDKPIYTPDSKVHFRIFAMTPSMKPVEKNTNDEQSGSITYEFVTPEEIVIPFDPVFLESGMYSGDYKLAEIVSVGVWKLVARFKSNPEQSFFANFEVKEYVLPSFEVKLTPESTFYDVSFNQLNVNIKATYLFGEDVKGSAYVIFGIIKKDGVTKNNIPSSLQRVKLVNGGGEAVLTKDDITKLNSLQALAGEQSSIFVSVSVLTETGSELVEAELKGIPIVTSPYTIHFTRTPKYFIPGLSFDVVVTVLNPNESPASGIRVMINPGRVLGVTGVNGLARVTINPQPTAAAITITAKTSDSNIPEERQAKAEMTALPYSTETKNYLHIGVDATDVTLGTNLKVNLHILKADKSPVHDITFLIQSRGQLVKHGHYRTDGQFLISMTEIITKEMLPSFRIIAYYHVNGNEIVSDAIWVDVKDTCMGSLKLESTGLNSVFEPKGRLNLQVTGDPGAKVALVAVDKAVFVLNNKGRLTQKKVWDTVEEHDTGCTPGGGNSSMGVFIDAGLLFESNTASGTPYRLNLKCHQQARSKRATTIMEVIHSLASRYEATERKCCMDGMKEHQTSYTCERRSQYISDGPACVTAFMICCEALEGKRAEYRADKLLLARSDGNDINYMSSDEITSRSKFPESWYWHVYTLPDCSPQKPNCGETSLPKNVVLQDSITTWQFIGISLSRTHGICVAEPLDVVVKKDFFIKLVMPYSAVRGEQLEIRAILYNYRTHPVTARVDFLDHENVCSSATKRGKYQLEVDVGALSSSAVPFVMIPMKIGHVVIEVKAVVKGSSSLYDGIRKQLRVVAEGVLQKSQVNLKLEPSTHNGKQVSILNSGIARKDIIPDTPTDTLVSATGGPQMSEFVENAVSGKAMESLIYEPTGCGEQNMIHMTLPVIATTYLDQTNQWETVGFNKRDEAIIHITTGYKRQLNYVKPDGSFAVWKSHPSSSWLTAYVAKVYAMASHLVTVDDDVLCAAVKWLILKTQQPDGIFKEVGKVIHGEMIGDVRGLDSDVSMTAFVLIAMQESQYRCSRHINSMPESMDKAVGYLEASLLGLTNPYAVAMASYALANADKLNKQILFKAASPAGDHWRVARGHVYTLEATAYALLALVKVKAFREASTIVKWFNTQQKSGGGYGSTQATIMVYQAVGEYWVNAKEEQYDMIVDIEVPGRALNERYSFNNGNAFKTRSAKHKGVNQDVTVTATGTGDATIKMVSLYYTYPESKKGDCKKFNLSVELLPDPEENTYKLRIEFMYLDMDKDAAMSILDIGLLTGFTANTKDLDQLREGVDRTISRYEMDKALSEKGSLILYLDKVSHTQPEEIAFRVTKTMNVGHLHPAAVYMYEYYDRKKCVKFYHPQRKEGQMLSICKKGECTCADENCSLQKKEKIDDDLRINKACDTDANNRIDFVYKVRLENIKTVSPTDSYSMRIEKVIKEGSFDRGLTGKLRTFVSYSHCREALDMQLHKSYLIMGTATDLYQDTTSQEYEYVLGERTWIEYWPTAEECQSANNELVVVCHGMEGLVQTYELVGCPQ